jgi:hypothetical protein
MVICGVCWVKAWITTRPRASEVMKFGSPWKMSSAAAGVIAAAADAGVFGAMGSAVRVDGGRGRTDDGMSYPFAKSGESGPLRAIGGLIIR